MICLFIYLFIKNAFFFFIYFILFNMLHNDDIQEYALFGFELINDMVEHYMTELSNL